MAGLTERAGPEGRLTTHVLDTALGRPGAGIPIELWRIGVADPTLIVSTVTNGDGRTASPLLEGSRFEAGGYELRFHVGRYFERQGTRSLYDIIPIRFALSDADGHYHIPLLVSAWSYTTYRGS